MFHLLWNAYVGVLPDFPLECFHCFTSKTLLSVSTHLMSCRLQIFPSHMSLKFRIHFPHMCLLLCDFRLRKQGSHFLLICGSNWPEPEVSKRKQMLGSQLRGHASQASGSHSSGGSKPHVIHRGPQATAYTMWSSALSSATPRESVKRQNRLCKRRRQRTQA